MVAGYRLAFHAPTTYIQTYVRTFIHTYIHTYVHNVRITARSYVGRGVDYDPRRFGLSFKFTIQTRKIRVNCLQDA
mgnify:CR=1 FL=1